jgi:hypothetical protein
VRREPESGTLYGVLLEHLATFLARPSFFLARSSSRSSVRSAHWRTAMSVRITIGCGCEIDGGVESDDEHDSYELDSDFREIWFDNYRVLQKLGVASLPSIGEVDEEESNEDFILVEVEPSAFLEWLDALAAKRTR